MPNSKLTNFLLLPKLFLEDIEQKKSVVLYHCQTKSSFLSCPYCHTKCSKIHDRRKVRVKDASNSAKKKILVITKKRFRCPECKKVTTEQIPGIQKSARITERMQRHLLYICNNFANMKSARKHLGLGNKTIYQRHYRQLELEHKKSRNNPWPTSIGIDEHSFIRNKKYGRREFVTLVVDHNNKRAKELVIGRDKAQLKASLDYIKGRSGAVSYTHLTLPTTPYV